MYEVEWVEDVPIDENGEMELDAAVYLQEFFHDRFKAVSFAQTRAKVDFFGCVALKECHYEMRHYSDGGPPVRVVVYDGEVEYFEPEPEPRPLLDKQ